MTPEDYNTKRAALVAARSSGELRVVFHSGGTRREVEYRSINELNAAIAALDADMAGIQGTRIRTFVPTFSKGLY